MGNDEQMGNEGQGAERPERELVTAGYQGTATAGYQGTATAGYLGTATAGNEGTATAGDRGTATAGYQGTATAGLQGTATAGYLGTATAGDRGTLIIRRWDVTAERFRVAIGYVGEDGIEAGVAYRLDDGGQFVRAEQPEQTEQPETQEQICD